MCGIAGIAGRGAGELRSVAEAMAATLRRRGPDARGASSFVNCVLAHTRLSILDLVTGDQPMRDRVVPVTISYNGEIYNFGELRASLESRGHRFVTRSDTEVILKAYIEYGSGCAEHLNGMFAFAIWDERDDTLFLARDRFGKKPLYYASDSAGNLLFGSEIKALLASGRLNPEIDSRALEAYLRLHYVPPTRTVYRNVQVLPPASILRFQNGKVEVQQYWSLPDRPIAIGYAEAREEVERLLRNAVRQRMVADVEVGTLLSGGVDSTIVTAYAQQYASHPVKTFAVGYGQHIDELPYAQAAADALGTDHNTLQVGGPELPAELEKVFDYLDEPHADTSYVAQSLVSRLAASRVKVALCGDGGDEVFLGYEWYWRHRGAGLRARLAQALFSSPYRDYLAAVQAFRPPMVERLWGGRRPDPLPITPPGFPGTRGGVREINRFDLQMYLPGQLLVKADRAAMLHSLEVRSPFFDRALIEFAVNLPVAYKTNGRTGKLILKDLLRPLFPASFVDRPKQGFGAPVREWLRTVCRPMLHDLLGSPQAAIYGYLDHAFVQEMVTRFDSGPDSSDYRRLWGLLCLELWFQAHRSPAGSLS